MANKKNNYEVVVGNIGAMPYGNHKLAMECFVTYVSLSKLGITKAAHKSVTLLKNGEIVKEHIGAIT